MALGQRVEFGSDPDGVTEPFVARLRRRPLRLQALSLAGLLEETATLAERAFRVGAAITGTR